MIDFINRELATLAVFISTIIHHTQFLIGFFLLFNELSISKFHREEIIEKPNDL